MLPIDVSGGAAQFVAALNDIRRALALSTPVPCHWNIPETPRGTTFDPTKINVQFRPPGGGAPIDFGFVKGPSLCAQATSDAWYYGGSDDPHEIIACPNTCARTLHDAASAEVDIVFGCGTRFSVPGGPGEHAEAGPGGG